MMTRPLISKIALLTYIVCTLTAMAPMSLGFVVLFAAWLMTFFHGWKLQPTYRNPTENFKKYSFWAYALLITCWGSLLMAGIFPYAFNGQNPEVTPHGFLKIWYLMIPAIFLGVYETSVENEPLPISKLLNPWWIMTILLTGISFIQFFTGWPQPQPIPTNPGRYHAILFFGHHLSTSSIIIFPAFAALAIVLGYLTRKNDASPTHGISFKLAFIAGIGGILTLFLSYARAGWLSLLLGIGILLQNYFGKLISKKKWFAAATAMIIILGLFSQTPLVKERITNLMGVNDRIELWKVNIEFFKVRPFTGIGWLKTQEMTVHYFKQFDPEHFSQRFIGHAHSNIFEMLGGTGLFGLLAFLGWSIFTIRLAYRLRNQFEAQGDLVLSDLSFGIMVALILLHLNGLTNVTFWEGKVMHQQMLAIAILLVLDRRLNSKIV